ncbi:hypothetical protein SDC9_99694 [bioreactor metagenome]|uniref:Uncharacterized protein n=1 Tax=bioreactor metagenome TaxID=1076179 RepID=A0A645AIB8_9ZZZZ
MICKFNFSSTSFDDFTFVSIYSRTNVTINPNIKPIIAPIIVFIILLGLTGLFGITLLSIISTLSVFIILDSSLVNTLVISLAILLANLGLFSLTDTFII